MLFLSSVHHSSSMVSLSTIDTEINRSRSRFGLLRKTRMSRLKAAQSTPDLQIDLETVNSGLDSSFRNHISEKLSSMDNVPRCRHCGLPDWSLHRLKEHRLNRALSTSMPTLTTVDLPDFDTLNLFDSSSEKNKPWARPSLRRLKLQHQTRHRNDSK